jgi:hypothetical protein
MIATLFTFFANMDKAGKLNADSKQKLQNRAGNFSFADFESSSIYVRAKISLTGIQELIDSNTKRIEGISSTEAGKIIQPACVDGILVKYATTTAANGALDNAGLADYGSTMPAALRNATLRITQSGGNIQEHLVSSLIEQGDATVNDGYALVFPFGVANTDIIGMSLKFPPGATADSDHHYVSVELRDVELKA